MRLSGRSNFYPLNDQVDLRTVRCRRTLYPGGKATTMDLTFKPVLLRDSDGAPKVRALVSAIPLVVQVSFVGTKMARRL